MSRHEFTGPAVVVDPYSSGALFAPAFAERGVEVVAVVTGPQPPAVYASSYRPSDFAEVITFEGDTGPIVDRLRKLGPRCVIAGCESGVELAEVLAPQVLPQRCNLPALAGARRDKGLMAAAVAAAGLAVIPQICTADADEVAAWLRSEGLHGADLVLKPPKSASTDGVEKLVAGNDWRAAFDRQLGEINRVGLVNDRMLVQQYAVGTEYVIDTFSHDGEHTLVDVCRYHKVGNGSRMAIYDAMAWMAPEDPVVPDLVQYARAVLDAVGIRFGPAHVEVMSTADGPRLIEVGARAHGGGQPRFCQVATGDSQIARTVDYLTGRPVAGSYVLLRHQLVVFLIARRAGVVRNAEVLDEIRALPSHHYSVHHVTDGQRLEPTKDLFDSLDLGFTVLSHANASQIRSDYRAVRAIEQRLALDDGEPSEAVA